jgi:hypothetical protein
MVKFGFLFLILIPEAVGKLKLPVIEPPVFEKTQ